MTPLFLCLLLSVADVSVMIRSDISSVMVDGVVVRGISPLPQTFGCETGIVHVDGRPYRGAVTVHKARRGKVTVINSLGLEDYLRGVVPSEMPADWPLESLKAQAIAARSYAVYRKESGDPLLPTIFDQVYRGMRVETETTNQAIDATMGIILCHEQRALAAYFHSSCGGMAEKPSAVWPGSAFFDGAFHLSPDSFCENSPHSNWTLKASLPNINAALRKLTGRTGLKDFAEGARDESGRVATFIATYSGPRGTVVQRTVSAPAFRIAFGPTRLKSVFCTLQREGNYFIFRGKGWGHGVGLCQWGARGMAESGFDCGAILSHYYPGAAAVSMIPQWPGE